MWITSPLTMCSMACEMSSVTKWSLMLYRLTTARAKRRSPPSTSFLPWMTEKVEESGVGEEDGGIIPRGGCDIWDCEWEWGCADGERADEDKEFKEDNGDEDEDGEEDEDEEDEEEEGCALSPKWVF